MSWLLDALAPQSPNKKQEEEEKQELAERRASTEPLQTWADWTTAVAHKPPESPQSTSSVPDESTGALDQLSVPSPMSRSVTVAHLQCAAGLLRDGYGTRDELLRLRTLVHDAATVNMGDDVKRELALTIKASETASDVADELVALAERYGDAEQREETPLDAALEVRVASARALIDKALVPRDTGVFIDAANEQTARLLVVICRRVSSGKMDADRVSRLLDAAFGSDEEAGTTTKEVVLRLESLRRRCSAKNGDGDDRPLRRADMLQLKHVVHSIVTLQLEGLDEEGPSKRPASQGEKSTEKEVKQLGLLASSVRNSAAAVAAQASAWAKRSTVVMAEKSWWFGASNPLMNHQRGNKPRSFVPPTDSSGVGRWSRPADALAAYEEASEARRGVRLAESPRIWCVSDVHVDASRNAKWLQSLKAKPEDAIIVAGDVASSLQAIGEALTLFRSKYKHVFYVPGNHELWVMFDNLDTSKKATDSVDKFFAILRLCDELGVHTGPAFVGEVLIVPLFSWYKRQKNGEDAGMLEYFDSACLWRWRGCSSSLDDPVADFFMALNYGALEWVEKNQRGGPVISFSHFVPHVPELFPGFVTFRHVMGCPELDAQIATLKPRVHIFGHSHINVDEIIGGTRYVQQALGHPSDGLSDSRDFGPLLIWTTGSPSVLDELSNSAVRSHDEAINIPRRKNNETLLPHHTIIDNFHNVPNQQNTQHHHRPNLNSNDTDDSEDNDSDGGILI